MRTNRIGRKSGAPVKEEGTRRRSYCKGKTIISKHAEELRGAGYRCNGNTVV